MKIGLGLGLTNKTAASGYTPLQSIISSTCCDLDATISDSTGTSGKWVNLTASPADGSDQADFDFYLGTSAGGDGAEPTLTNGDHYLFDGADYMESVQTGANAPALWKNMHKGGAGNDYWIAYCIYHASTSTNASVFDTWQDSGSKVDGFATQIVVSTNPDQTHHVHNNGGQVIIDTNGFPAQTDVLVIHSFDSDTETLRVWMNSDTATETDASAYTTGSTDAACNPATIGQVFNGNPLMPNGNKLYALSMGNGYLTNAQAAAIRDEYEARHGRTY